MATLPKNTSSTKELPALNHFEDTPLVCCPRSLQTLRLLPDVWYQREQRSLDALGRCRLVFGSGGIIRDRSLPGVPVRSTR